VSFTPWLVLAALILANALYVSAEFGAVGARRSRIRRLAEDGRRSAQRLLPFIQDPAALVRYVAASQIGITLAGLTLGAYAQSQFGERLTAAIAGIGQIEWTAAHSAATIVILAGLTAGELVLGELVPKSLALQYPTEVALFTIRPMQWSLTLFRPLAALLNVSGQLMLRLAGSKDGSHRHIHSPDEIELLIAESRDGGLLEPDEHRRLHKALKLGLRSARDLMVPLDRLTMVPADAGWEGVLGIVSASPFSRLPVYRGSRDQIVGTLRVADLVSRYVAEGPVGLDRLIRPAVEIAHDLPADRVISVLRERHVHQAVIVDRPGHAIGVITVQDVLSELLGTARSR
jgi:CBS domain containing-hemolysin-like protein